MAARKPVRRMRPATTLEGRENQLISKAYDLAEKQLDAGTASAQVQSHFLKMGSTRERLEQERIRNDNLVLSAKAEQMASGRRMEELYEDAIIAMRRYNGHQTEDVELYD